MIEYKVLKNGFFGGIYREPNGAHDPVVVEGEITPCPTWLELIKTRKVAPKNKNKSVPSSPEIQGMKMKGEDVVYKD